MVLASDNTNSLQCHLALEAYLIGLCAILIDSSDNQQAAVVDNQTTNQSILGDLEARRNEKGRYLLSELYERS